MAVLWALCAFLLLVASALADADSCHFSSQEYYLSSEVAHCLRGAYSSDSYGAPSLIGSARAAASQYYLMEAVEGDAVNAGLTQLYLDYPLGGDWSPYDLEMDIARVFRLARDPNFTYSPPSCMSALNYLHPMRPVPSLSSSGWSVVSGDSAVLSQWEELVHVQGDPNTMAVIQALRDGSSIPVTAMGSTDPLSHMTNEALNRGTHEDISASITQISNTGFHARTGASGLRDPVSYTLDTSGVDGCDTDSVDITVEDFVVFQYDALSTDAVLAQCSSTPQTDNAMNVSTR
ncbi:hypothetical protein KIPB_010441 [Kipferlia bialata]|uniref:Uncharacterized protein n=1 Tax=Kipferlia bialata TaxID=797122 RepID=A0A9K3D575_9EUKA|nr:hypothetical protein KIPB_010441 [Kipferlia bialata]|eukprot:g10441.t1